MRKSHKNAFTLVEILVGIAIIAIMILGFSNINFNRFSKNQELEIELIKIQNIILETRNNALIGKSAGINLENPEYWSININTSGSGTIQQSYSLNGEITTEKTWTNRLPFIFGPAYCQRLNGENDTMSTNLEIRFTGARGELIGCSDSDYKKINFQFEFSNITKSISFNALTGILEVN